MGKKQILSQGYRHENHPLPVTRRQLLSQGFYSGSAMLLAPSILTVFARRAYGATDPAICAVTSSGTKLVPVVIIDLAGGANIAGTNVLMGTAGSQTNFLSAASYQTAGLSAAAAPGAAGITPDTSLGLAFHPKSPMLAGIKSAATAVGTNVEGTLFCTTTADDTKNNPLSPIYWLAKAGLSGSLISLVGSNNGVSGGNSTASAASIDPAKAPTIIAKASDASGIVDPGKLATLLGAGGAADSASVTKVMAAVKTMSASRLATFQAQDLQTQIQDLVNCGYINSSDYFSKFTPAALDATQDPLVTGVFGAGAGTGTTQTLATISKLVIDGYAGAGVVSLGGYDYHGQGRASQTAKDMAAGVAIGQVLQLAAKKQSPVMVHVITDGGVSVGGAPAPDANGFLPFSNDSAQHSACFTLVYSPTAKPTVRSAGRQIGGYNAAGSVDNTAGLTSNNVDLLAQAVAGNWLALHGKEGNLATVVGADNFAGNLAKYLMFTKLV